MFPGTYPICKSRSTCGTNIQLDALQKLWKIGNNLLKASLTLAMCFLPVALCMKHSQLCLVYFSFGWRYMIETGALAHCAHANHRSPIHVVLHYSTFTSTHHT